MAAQGGRRTPTQAGPGPHFPPAVPDLRREMHRETQVVASDDLRLVGFAELIEGAGERLQRHQLAVRQDRLGGRLLREAEFGGQLPG